MKLPKSNIKSNSSGYTLIELLVVVMLIVVLSGLVLRVLNVEGVRGKSRDAQRIADLNKMQTALELYFADNRTYPDTSGWINTEGSSNQLATDLVPGYMSDLPVDPRNTSTAPNPCADENEYRYNYLSLDTDGSGNVDSYILTAMMEVEITNDTANNADELACHNLTNWAHEPDCSAGPGTTNYCYGVQNP